MKHIFNFVSLNRFIKKPPILQKPFKFLKLFKKHIVLVILIVILIVLLYFYFLIGSDKKEFKEIDDDECREIAKDRVLSRLLNVSNGLVSDATESEMKILTEVNRIKDECIKNEYNPMIGIIKTGHVAKELHGDL